MKNDTVIANLLTANAMFTNQQVLHIRLQALNEEHDRVNHSLNYQYRALLNTVTDNNTKNEIQLAYMTALQNIANDFLRKQEEISDAFQNGGFSYNLKDLCNI